LICVPNGQLYSLYGKDIFGGGKIKRKSFRYVYSREPHFRLLTKKYKKGIFRIELIYLAKDLNVSDITTLSTIPVHSQF